MDELRQAGNSETELAEQARAVDRANAAGFQHASKLEHVDVG